MMHFFHTDDLARERAERGKLYFEFLRVPALSAGVYVLAVGARDPQKPHHEDEMYYVIRGRARMQIGSGDASEHADVRAGSVIFVEAEMRASLPRHYRRTGSAGLFRARRAGVR